MFKIRESFLASTGPHIGPHAGPHTGPQVGPHKVAIHWGLVVDITSIVLPNCLPLLQE